MRNKKGQFVKGSKELVTHDLSKTRQYNIWNHMMFRCYSKKDERYNEYGGRGIIVCSNWHTFIGFWEDMKNGYSDKLTLDRINNNGNYFKENCRWTTQTQQCRNKRSTLKVKYNGVERVLIELCNELKISYMMVYLRIKRYNWGIDKAISTPSKQI